MSRSTKTSVIRQRIAVLKKHRDRLESELLKRRRIVRAYLLERFLGSTQRKRQKPYYYLSRAEKGRTILVYVPLADVQRVRARTDAWREFSSRLSKWIKVTREIEKLFRSLGEKQSEQYRREG